MRRSSGRAPAPVVPDYGDDEYEFDAIGRRVQIFWSGDGCWFKGVVKQFNGATGQHLVRPAPLTSPQP